jgi:ABC-type dipeptide/oligopeptide/nickel transport system ATPase component
MSALVGESGAGKSVLAWSILGLTKPPGRVVKGDILWRGENIVAMSANRLRQIRGREISLIVSSPRSHLHPLIRIGHQIEAAYRPADGERSAREATLDMLKAVEMPDAWRIYRAYPHELSGGMAQRVLIAMALINSPHLVIADDATNALDVTVQRQVLDLMTSLIHKRQASALMITHDLGIVAQYCQRATVVCRGEVYEVADTPQLFGNPVHPYTRALLAKARRRKGVHGPSELVHAAWGSKSMHPMSISCKGNELSELQEVEPGHFVRPWQNGDFASEAALKGDYL